MYNVGNHTPVDLGAFIKVIEAKLGRTALKNLLPMQPGDVPETFADVERLVAATNFSPKTPLGQGVGLFVDWYRAFYGV